MKFIFTNKNEVETDIITKILSEEKISFKVIKNQSPVYIINNFAYKTIDNFDIICYTDLQHYDFVKKIADKEIEKIKEHIDKIKTFEKIYQESSDVVHCVTIGKLTVSEYKPKKSMLKKLVEIMFNK